MKTDLVARYAAIVAALVTFPLADFVSWLEHIEPSWWLYLGTYPAAFLGAYLLLSVFADDVSARRRRSGMLPR